MTLLATDCDPTGIDEMLRLADILDSDGWRFIKGRKLETDILPVQRFLLVKPSLRIVAEREGSLLSLEFEIDGEPPIHLDIALTPPRTRSSAEDATALCEWASGICRTLVTAPRVGIGEIMLRMTAIGNLVVCLTGIAPTDGMGSIEWNPPSRWTRSTFGDSLRFLTIPEALDAHLGSIASCVKHVRSVDRPVDGSRITHRISRIEITIDHDEPLDPATMMRMINELGIDDAHLRREEPVEGNKA